MLDTKSPSLLYRTLVALFVSISWPIVALAVRFGPSFTASSVPEWFVAAFPWFVPLVFAAIFALRFVLVGIHRTLPFVLLGVAIFASQAALVIASSTLIHRDFFTSLFQEILCLPIIFFYFLRTREQPASRTVLVSMGRTGYTFAFVYVQWIMLMGYAISTRAEPRPIEALIYNAYNLSQAVFLFLSSRALGQKALHTVEIRDDRILVNGKDMTSILTPKQLRLITAFFATPERRLSCPEIQRILYGEETRPECAECDEERTKPTQCARYRTTYNTILDLKKSLEFLEIGTIMAGENRRLILREGWRLAVFENVRVTGLKEKRPAIKTGR
jgi:hypothetical protein